jgi:hypothetical protein
LVPPRGALNFRRHFHQRKAATGFEQITVQDVALFVRHERSRRCFRSRLQASEDCTELLPRGFERFRRAIERDHQFLHVIAVVVPTKRDERNERQHG